MESLDHAAMTGAVPFRRTQSVSSHRSQHTKRLSLHFPVLPPPQETTAYQSPVSPEIIPAVNSGRSSPRVPHPKGADVESPDFLTLLASQERKVLELREELQRAEGDLSALKKQWATFEASKKKSELMKVAKLVPMHLTSAAKDGSAHEKFERATRATTDLDMERPKRRSAPRVFSNSRHARALSLLSVSSNGASPASRASSDDASMPTDRPGSAGSRPSVERTASLPVVDESMALGKTYKLIATRQTLGDKPSDTIITQSRQMAVDLKEGLWTFWEDIRQATVGDEAIHGPHPVRGGSSGRVRPAKQSSHGDLRRKRKSTPKGQGHAEHAPDSLKADTAATRTTDKSFWQEFGVDSPKRSDTTETVRNHGTSKENVKPGRALVDVDDSWEAWDTPRKSTVVTQDDSQGHIRSEAWSPSGPSTQAGRPGRI